MSPKGAKYQATHAYGKRRKPWNKRRKLDTEADAADLTEQETPEHLGDRESSAVCDRDSASVWASYDLTTGRADGMSGVCDASACGVVSTCRVERSACGDDVSMCRVDESTCGLDASTSSGDRASASNGNVTLAPADVRASSIKQRISAPTLTAEEIARREEMRVDALNALSDTPATKRKFQLMNDGESDKNVVPEASFFIANKVMMDKLLSTFRCHQCGRALTYQSGGGAGYGTSTDDRATAVRSSPEPSSCQSAADNSRHGPEQRSGINHLDFAQVCAGYT
ncbi:hypothetical protein HPB51_022356 [Rhipicephalus microplus]|uniref:Uncharacterized protein n=1 Tax=Rhipicephalus microplus TaxID=6941 RepID=A0A9J6EUZ3_RHIMP|nr:hypothetical protein HPB51_022356 [Rhipicephalus microplus]